MVCAFKPDPVVYSVPGRSCWLIYSVVPGLLTLPALNKCLWQEQFRKAVARGKRLSSGRSVRRTSLPTYPPALL